MKTDLQKWEAGKISVVMTTYNRSHMIEKSIQSLLDQTYSNVEIIIVDNGSTDDTPQVLDKYRKEEYCGKIRLFRLEENKRFTGGANHALDQIKGEWFTILDDDDIAYPEAFETMMKVLDDVDRTISAINCNCIDSSTGELSGQGLKGDGYLTFKDLIYKCRGEFWGITKTELLGDIRFNDRLYAYDETFWYKINLNSRRYYIHKPLRVYVTDHGERDAILFHKKDRVMKTDMSRRLLNEDFYWECLAKYRPMKYNYECLKGFLYMQMDEDYDSAEKFLQKLRKQSRIISALARISQILPGRFYRVVFERL